MVFVEFVGWAAALVHRFGNLLDLLYAWLQIVTGIYPVYDDRKVS